MSVLGNFMVMSKETQGIVHAIWVRKAGGKSISINNNLSVIRFQLLLFKIFCQIFFSCYHDFTPYLCDSITSL